jgi:SAM-dependent methyltransferase
MDAHLPEPGRYHSERPSDLRRLPRHHRLAYVVRRLDGDVAALIPDLGAGAGSRVLDYGCAEMPYRDVFPRDCEYVGADIRGNPRASIEIAADGTLPVPDADFDALISTQVLEHVEDPAVYLAECRRVLRPGGRALITTHGTMVWHPDPVDFWRWTAQGLERAISDAGLEVVRTEGIIGLAATGLLLLQDGLLLRLPVRLHRAVGFAFQLAIAGADKLSTADDRRMNALVYGVIARRPD